MAYKYIEPTERTYAKAYKIGNNITPPVSINIKEKYPNVDYTKLTNADFICSYNSDSTTDSSGFKQTQGNRQTWYIQVNALSINHSYNPNTGVLSVTKSTDYATSSNIADGTKGWSGLKCDVVMIVDGIRSEYT